METGKQKIENIVKDQHYVPKFYLKSFENDEHLVERLDVKRNKLLEPKSKSAICCEKFFYGVNTGVEDSASQNVEKHLGDLENKISKAVPEVTKILLSDEMVDDYVKYSLAIYMAMLYLRGPAFRHSMNSTMQSGISQFRKILSHNFPKETIEKTLNKYFGARLSDEELKKIIEDENANLEFNNTLHLEMLNELRGFANMLFGQEWLVYRNKTSKPFITSDNPLGSEHKESRGLGGYGFMEYTYHFALSPEIHIVTRCPEKEFGKKIHRKSIDDADQIAKLNFFVMNSCIEQVYANSEETLEELSKVIAIARLIEHPDLDFLNYLPKQTKKTTH